MKPRIFLIDDDDDFIETYQTLLGKEGYEVQSARSTAEARVRLLEPEGWDVVLLDQRLRGKDGPDEGIDFITEAIGLCPAAKIILVTGYASSESIERAFDRGAFDYLQKDEPALFRTFLRVKIRNALALTQARDLAVAIRDDRAEAELRATWEEARHEKDRNRKGERLERVVALLFVTIPGMRPLEPRRKNKIEEIDVMIRFEPTAGQSLDQVSYLLVECKNWSSPVGVDEARSFLWKLSQTHGRSKLGLFIAMKGGTKGFYATLDKESHGEKLVIVLDEKGLDKLISSTNRLESLKALLDRAILDPAPVD